jgi:hypothetical protein
VLLERSFSLQPKKRLADRIGCPGSRRECRVNHDTVEATPRSYRLHEARNWNDHHNDEEFCVSDVSPSFLSNNLMNGLAGVPGLAHRSSNDRAKDILYDPSRSLSIVRGVRREGTPTGGP